ncbi:calpain-2 catalytic subunit-like [Anomaloglossus baeobatrachus]|uniref:calpain-2 catalytic subunit-like isoform X2 n=1 Tax=Anomaloglossus baeobatrachus TaxID=238106 RepID=UPI003F4FB546
MANMNLASKNDLINSLETPKKFQDQDFERLKEFHLEKKSLFTDEYFPADTNSIGSDLKKEIDTSKIVWKSPKVICKEPCFTVDGMSISDILHRRRGNCWLFSAIGSITKKREALDKIIPDNQGFRKNYAGIFHFRFWNLGEWVDVVIDDRLPFLDGKYLSVQPSCENEFWPCLLEKAYAKFLGSYEKLLCEDQTGTLVNLTGGLTITFDLKSIEAQSYWNIIKLAGREAIMTCISDKQNPLNQKLRQRLILSNFKKKAQENVLQENGLVDHHAYSIIGYEEVSVRVGVVKLIRLWNPWGSGEWKGNWNDRCPLWKELSEADRLKLQRIDDDGEFWMCWDDFIKEFSKLIICNQVPDFFDWGNQHKKWYRNMFRSQWMKENLSWNRLDKEFFKKNFLYRITVTAADEVKGGRNVVVSLMQDSINLHRFGDWLSIGFVLLQLPDSQDKTPDSLSTLQKMSSTKPSKNHNVTEAFHLAPGRYGILPYTTEKEHESAFLFQVFLKSEGCADGCN